MTFFSLIDKQQIPVLATMSTAAKPEVKESRPSRCSTEIHKPIIGVTVNVDCILVGLTLLSFITRLWRLEEPRSVVLWRLEEPRSVVFDEVHFGRFTSYYMQGIFFFDLHPPLGKLLLAAGGYVAGFQGNFQFTTIGQEYPCDADIPIWHLRLIPAVFGALLCPVMYQIFIKMGFKYWTATLAASLVLFDNALLTQSRFILIDSMMLFFSVLSMYSLVRFRRLKDRAFSKEWWSYLCLLGVSITCAISVKYAGVFTVFIIGVILLYDYWQLIGDKTKTARVLLYHLLSYFSLLVLLPIVLYLAIFYVNLQVLYKSGPHDDRMTSAFQASLEGGLSRITKGQPLEVAFGSQITLRHTHGNPCWLHSHKHLYPIRYSDGRGSSAQQQVTCYSFKDTNNWWIVKNPNHTNIHVVDPPEVVKHGDVVQLIHGMSGRALNSHDVAAPESPQLMEVTCYIDYNISHAEQSLWKVEIVNADVEGDTWQAIKSQVRFIHLNTSQALKMSGTQLPEWGFYQFEVATDRIVIQDQTIWNVEEHKYTRFDKDGDISESLQQAEEDQPYSADSNHQLGFMEKFFELQWKMLAANQEVHQEHRYSSDPLEWPMMERGIAYWMNPLNNAQIHFLGNPVIWWSSLLGIPIFVLVLCVFVIRWCRQCPDMSSDEWEMYLLAGMLFGGGWLANYLPYFLMERTLFLHHYLPAYICKLALLPVTVQLIYSHVLRCKIHRSVFTSLIAVWFTMVVMVFYQFVPFCYGHYSVSDEDIESARWMETWGFLLHSQLHL